MTTEPTEVPDADDVEEDLPTLPPEGEIPQHAVPPTEHDWTDGSADDALPTG